MKKITLWRMVLASLMITMTIAISCKKLSDLNAYDAGTVAQASVTGSLTKLVISSVSTPAAVDGVNVKDNIIDGNLNTHWSGENDASGSQTITFDLGLLKNVASIKIAFVTDGNPTRTSNFDVAVSQNGTTGWVTVLNNQNSTPNVTALQTFDFGDVDGQYVRITGHGNSTGNGWNSYSEVEIYGYSLLPSTSIQFPVLGGYVTSPATIDPGNVAANVVDGNLNTRWSGLSDSAGAPQYLNINLGATDTLDYVKIAFATGGSTTRTSLFAVSVSPDSISWTTVVPKSRSTANNTALETFDFADLVGKFIRITGYGNTTNNWNSLTEVQIWGRPQGQVTTVADWETGNRNQWYGYVGLNEANELSIVTSPVRQGTYAAKFVTHPGDTVPGYGTEHNEVSLWAPIDGSGYTQEKMDDNWYYGWSTLFPVGWVKPNTTWPDWGIITQWHPRNDANPSINFTALGDSLTLVLNTGSIGRVTYSNGDEGYSYTHNTSHVLLTSLSKGLWHDFIVHIKFRPDSTGTVEVWHRLETESRLVQILHLTNIPTMQWCSDALGFNTPPAGGGTGSGGIGADEFIRGGVHGWAAWTYLREGLYRNRETVNTNTLYFDNFIRGNNYSAIRARMK